MKKLILILAISLGMLAIGFAQTKTNVNVRASKQDNFTRLVFEAEEAFIKNTNASSSGTHLTVQFPSDFNLVIQKGFALENAVKDRYLIINIKEQFDMKVMKLSSPPRLVVDITSKVSQEARPQPDVILSQKIFVIDAGHGGYDFGMTNNELKEKDISLLIVRELEGALIKKGKAVHLTRKSDQFVSLKDRSLSGNQKSPDVFLSIHMSSTEKFNIYTTKVPEQGAEQSVSEIYSVSLSQKKYVQKSRILAEKIGNALKEDFKTDVVLRDMAMPLLDSVGAAAVLIEIPSFRKMNYDQKTIVKFSDAVLKGLSYYGQ